MEKQLSPQLSTSGFIICPICYKQIPLLIFLLSRDSISIEIECSCLLFKKLYSLDEYLNSLKISINRMENCLEHNQKQQHYCPDCFKCLCTQCIINHSTSEPNHHLILNYEVQLKCEEHQAEYSSYCFQCRRNLCLQCASSKDNHLDHQIVKIPLIDRESIEKEYSTTIEALSLLVTIKTNFVHKLDSLLLESSKEPEKVMKLTQWKEELLKAFQVNQKKKSLLILFIDSLLLTHSKIGSSPIYNLNKLLQNIKFTQPVLKLDQDEDLEVQYTKLKNYLLSFHFVVIISDIKCIGQLSEHKSYVNCIIQLTDKTIASGSDDCSIILWNATSMTVIKTITAFTFPINCLLQLKDGRLLSGTYNSIFIWAPVTFEEKGALNGHGDFVYAILQLSNGLIASSSRDSTIKLWDEKELSLKATLTGHQDSIYCLIQLNDKRLVTGSCDRNLMLWNTESYANEAVYKGHNDAISSIIQIDDKTIISGSYDRSIKVWDVTLNCVVTTLIGHNHYLLSIILLRNGNLMSCSCDAMIKLWDLKTFKCLLTLLFPHSVRCFIQLENDQIACGSNQSISLYSL